MSARRGSRRRRPPEIQAALEALKRKMAQGLPPRTYSGPPGRWGDDNGPMVSRLLDLADRHVSTRRDPARPDGPP